MITKPQNFELYEFVCPHVFRTFGGQAWSYLDPRLMITVGRLRKTINKKIIGNNWHEGGTESQRGLRCTQCQIVKDWCAGEEVHTDPHMHGSALDFDVEGMTADEVRAWIIANATLWPYPIRLEENVTWIHLDTWDMDSGEKIFLFNK